MDQIEMMHNFCIAEEGVLDKFRKSKLTSPNYQNYQKFSSVKEFVEYALQNDSDGKAYAMVRGIRLGLGVHREENRPSANELEVILTNGLANMQKIHKAICMRIVDEFNSGTDTPWAWQDNAPYKTLSLSNIEKEIQAEGCFVSFYKAYASMECAFTDGPNNIYGGHSLVVYGRIPSDVYDAKGKWIGNPKTVDFSIEG